MRNKSTLILILIFFMLFTAALSGAASSHKGDDGKYSKYKTAGTMARVFADEPEFQYMGETKIFYGTGISNAVAPTRQVYNTVVTTQDRQHYITPGRQIVYAGYYNAACDYVYMDWASLSRIGGTEIRQVLFGVFDWPSGIWDFTASGPYPVSLNAWGRAPVLNITPDNGWSVACYRTRADDASPYYTGIAYDNACLGYSHIKDTVPGPPNLAGIGTGYCDDSQNDPIGSPYIFPHIDVDTTDGGLIITHVATYEGSYCTNQPDAWIDASSLLYHRKISTVQNQPWTGTWEGPFLMDSSYLLSQIVRADKRPGNHTVYYAYMKPMFYASGPLGTGEHPCTSTFNSIFWQWTHDVVYKVSTNDGDTWSDPIYVTDAKAGFADNLTIPANQDLTALVDPEGTFHLVWNAQNWDTEDACSPQYGSKLWHWDNSNNCISLVYDASHPAYFRYNSGESPTGAWNEVVSKCNISWCDDKLYVSFTRFGAHTEPGYPDTATDYGHNVYLNGDIMVVGSDATGGMGQTWTDGINLTDTETDSCLPGDCMSEHWSTMAMYSSDSLMILYIEDKEPGAYDGGNDSPVSPTNNPVIFMTWPCFTMADVGSNVCVSSDPTNPNYAEIPLAPNGQTSGCNTEASYSTTVILTNCGNSNLSYSTSSDQGWLAVTAGGTGAINAGTGPRGADLPIWNGAPGCASPANITWQANSSSLGQGNYTGHILVDIDNPLADDIQITINLVVACEYYLPENARITGGCWAIDLWNTPQAANQSEDNSLGNMKFYTCGDTINPLYHEGLMVGWKVGAEIYCYSDAITQDSTQLHMRALSNVTVDSVGTPSSGSGYFTTLGYWSTPDSMVQGKIEYFIPGHQDTSVLIEKVTMWNLSGTTLSDFIVGEESDWDCDRDSALDAGGIDPTRNLVYLQGDHNDQSVTAGLSPYAGQDGNFAAMAINGYDYAYYSLGWYPDTMYNVMSGLSGLSVFSDSTNGTEMRVINRFIKGSLGATDTIEICKVKAVSLDGVTGLQELIDKGMTYIEDHELCAPPPECQGRCGNANGDLSVNVSDAVYVINYVFVGGNTPLPVKACGNANGDASVNVSDAVYIINFVFVGGAAPGDCHPGVWGSEGGDCCPY